MDIADFCNQLILTKEGTSRSIQLGEMMKLLLYYIRDIKDIMDMDTDIDSLQTYKFYSTAQNP